MGLNEASSSDRPSTPCQLTRPRIESVLGPATDGKIDKLLVALEGTLVQQQDAMRTHSFQIVRLQNQIQELQNTKSQDEEIFEAILEDLTRSRTEIAYLKGRLAGLAVEVYSGKPNDLRRFEGGPGQNVTHRPLVDLAAAEANVTTPGLNTTLLEETMLEPTQAAQLLADQLLIEQRPRLIKALESCYKAHQLSCIQSQASAVEPNPEGFSHAMNQNGGPVVQTPFLVRTLGNGGRQR